MQNTILQDHNAIKFETTEITEGERFNYWNEVVCKQIINIESHHLNNHPSFKASLVACTYDDIGLLELYSDPTVFHRTKYTIARDSADYLLLTSRLSNNSEISLNQQQFSVNEGDLNFFHCGREQTLHLYGSVGVLVMKIPIKRMDKFRFWSEDLNGLFLRQDKPIVKILNTQMTSLASNFHAIPLDRQSALVDNFLNLVSITIDSINSKTILTSEKIKDSLLNDIILFINSNLHHYELTPNYIAAKYRISLRYLYLLFKSRDTTPSHFIKTERLKTIAYILKTDKKVRICDLAYRYGFSQVSHFNRVFKAEYGVSPTEYRAD